MLPSNRIAARRPLYSPRGGTFLTPETLILSYAEQEWTRRDESLITDFHEGLHWTQFHGTTIGAFYYWVKHSQELNVFDHLRRLNPEVRRRLLAGRLRGQPILSLDPENDLPQPRLGSKDLKDPVNLLRMIWYDHLFTLKFFTNPKDIVATPDDPSVIFPSVISDAALYSGGWHPQWKDVPGPDLRELYALEPGSVRRLGDPNGEITTYDLFEAGAGVSELIAGNKVEQGYYLSPDSSPTTLWAARDPGIALDFSSQADDLLQSAYGGPLRVFIQKTAFDPYKEETWLAAIAVIDFALNPPLPPIVPPPSEPAGWPAIYPPIRFLLGCVAAKRLGRLSVPPNHESIALYLSSLADLLRLPDPVSYRYPERANPLPDFSAFVREHKEPQIYSQNVDYYHFVLSAQEIFWKARAGDLAQVVAPAFSIGMWNDPAAWLHQQNTLGRRPPVIRSHDDELEHAAGSSTQFGTWFALSCALHCTSMDLMIGTGVLSLDGFPRSLLAHPEARSLVLRNLSLSLDEGTVDESWLVAPVHGASAG